MHVNAHERDRLLAAARLHGTDPTETLEAIARYVTRVGYSNFDKLVAGADPAVPLTGLDPLEIVEHHAATGRGATCVGLAVLAATLADVSAAPVTGSVHAARVINENVAWDADVPVTHTVTIFTSPAGTFLYDPAFLQAAPLPCIDEWVWCGSAASPVATGCVSGSRMIVTARGGSTHVARYRVDPEALAPEKIPALYNQIGRDPTAWVPYMRSRTRTGQAAFVVDQFVVKDAVAGRLYIRRSRPENRTVGFVTHFGCTPQRAEMLVDLVDRIWLAARPDPHDQTMPLPTPTEGA